MVRALKILGDISLASIDRGMKCVNPKIQEILKITKEHMDTVNYEDIFYQNLSTSTEAISYQKPKV